MGSPSGVCNTCVGIEDLCEIWFLILDELLQLCHLANLFKSKHFILLVAIHSKTCRVVSSIFQSRETVDKSVNYVAAVFLHQVINVSEDATVVEGQ
jgi:hypothetical protein